MAIQAAITAGRRTAAAGSRAKSIRHKVDLKIPSRTKLGITVVEMQIRRDQKMHFTAEEDTFSLPTESIIDKYIKKRPHPAAIFAQYNLKQGLFRRLKNPAASHQSDLSRAEVCRVRG